MNYWPNIQTYKPKSYPLSDGLNIGMESIEIKESEATSLVNMDSSLYPTLTVRDGNSLYTQQSGYYISKLFNYNGTWIIGNSKGIYKLVNGVWTAIYEQPSADNDHLWEVIQFLDKIYFIDQTNKVKEYDGTTLTTMTQSPTGANALITYANRLYATKDNTLFYSALRLPSDWTTVNDSGQIVIETQDGEKISGLASYGHHVIVFKPSSFHELYGTGPYNYEMVQSSDSIGCISNRSIKEVNGVLYWLGKDGIYAYMGGSMPVNVADPKIIPYIERLNTLGYQHCVGGTDGTRYYISLVLDNDSTPSITLVYDPRYKSWWEFDTKGTGFAQNNNDFYYANANGDVLLEGGTTDNGTAILWERISGLLTDGDATTKKSIHKLWIVADIEANSTFNISYSTDSEGDNFTLVKSVTPTGKLQNIKLPIIIPPSEWFRIKLHGTGKCKIHEMVREVSRRG